MKPGKKLREAAARYLEREHRIKMADFERAPLASRPYHWTLDRGEGEFWTEFYNLQVQAFAAEFGPKYTPELSTETDRFLVGTHDMDAIITAIRHIQSFLAQHDKDHDTWDRIHGCTR